MKHYNPSIAEDVSRIFNLKGEFLEEIDDKITPVVNIRPRVNIVKSASATNATTTTIYTTPIDKDFYLTGYSISVIKDVTATSTSSFILFKIDGINCAIGEIAGITLTPQTLCMAAQMAYPIKIDKLSTITIQNSTNTANVKATGSITGYTQETIKGT